MGLFSKLFGGDASDSNENIRKADESFDEYAERVKQEIKALREEHIKSVQPTTDLSDITKANIEAAYASGLITREQAQQSTIKNCNRKAEQQQNKAEPIGDWFIDNDGFMKRPWSDGSLRRE